jgi:hypothetical protein
MRVIEQLVLHFWNRGALSQDEVIYLVKHGFVRQEDLPGLFEEPTSTVPESESEVEPADRRYDREGVHVEELEDELTGRNSGGGKKGGKKKKPAGHNLAPAAACLANHIAEREPYPALIELGSRLGPCGNWRDAARCIASSRPEELEAALLALLDHRPRALGELWFWFDLEQLFDWTEQPANAGPVAEGIRKLMRADTPARVGRLEQLKKAVEVQALIDLLAARRPFLAQVPKLYESHFDKLGLWLIPPGGIAARSWPSLPWAYVIVYNARNGTADEPPPGYLLPLTLVHPYVVMNALQTAFPMEPRGVRELLLHDVRQRLDPMPTFRDLAVNMVFDRPLFCPYTWKV